MVSEKELENIAREAVAKSKDIAKADTQVGKLGDAEDKAAAKLQELKGAETPNKDKIATATAKLREAKAAHKDANKARNALVKQVTRDAIKGAKDAAKQVAKDLRDKERAAKREAKEAEKAARKEANTLEVRNGQTHPKKGGITCRLWELMDEMQAAIGETPSIQDVMAKGRKITEKENTLKAQYARWKKFNGHPNSPKVVKEKPVKKKAAAKKKAVAKKTAAKKKATAKKRAAKK